MEPDALELVNRKFLMLMIFLPLFTGALFGLGISLYAWTRRTGMRRWQAAPGRVTAVRGVQRPARGLFGRRQYVLDLEVEYVYQWEETTYKAVVTREAELPRSSTPLDEAVVNPAVERLKGDVEGMDMAVYVNPARPEQSLVEMVETRRDTIAVAAFAAASLVLGAVCVWLVL